MAKLGRATITGRLADVINADGGTRTASITAAGSPWRRPSPRTAWSVASSAACRRQLGILGA